jgi:hypothetical protein
MLPRKEPHEEAPDLLLPFEKVPRELLLDV